jgi:hypothetical protein
MGVRRHYRSREGGGRNWTRQQPRNPLNLPAWLQCWTAPKLYRHTYIHTYIDFKRLVTSSFLSFLGIEKAVNTTWHPGLLYKLSKLHFSTRIIKLISSFVLQRKFRVSVEGEMSTPRRMQAGVPQGSVLCSSLYNLYINDTPKL